MDAVVFRIYSGGHSGAQIELTPGTWVIGRDDSCDIILTDASIAARHAALIVEASEVSCEPLDGKISAADGGALKGLKLAPGALWRFGSVIAAWGAADASESFWDAVAKAVQDLSHPALTDAKQTKPSTDAAAAANDSSLQETLAQANGETAQSLQGVSDTSSGSNEGEHQQSVSVSWKGRVLAALFFLLLLFAAGLFLSPGLRGLLSKLAAPAGTEAAASYKQTVTPVKAGEPAALLPADEWIDLSLPPSEPDAAKAANHPEDVQFARAQHPQTRANWVVRLLGPEGFFARWGVRGDADAAAAAELAALNEALMADGFNEVKAVRAETGAYLFAGSVKNDEERGRLLKLARSILVPVVLDLKVDSDYTEAVRSAFNSLDFWPEVKLEKAAKTAEVKNGKAAAEPNAGDPEEKKARDRLVVAAYMFSNIVEEKAFDEASGAVPMQADGSHRMTVVRRIRYQPEIDALLTQTFRRFGVTDVNAQYLPGRIRLSATLTPQRRLKLDEALENLRRTAGVPLKIDVINQTPKAASEPKQTASAPAAAKPASDPMKPTFRVTGVSGGAIQFVTLSTNEKVFVGGRLPGGFTLESISHTRLILSKNGKRIQYPLKTNK